MTISALTPYFTKVFGATIREEPNTSKSIVAVQKVIFFRLPRSQWSKRSGHIGFSLAFAVTLIAFLQTGRAWSDTVYSRGVWYDYGGIPLKNLSQKAMIEELSNEHIDRVHIMVDDPFWVADNLDTCEQELVKAGDQTQRNCVNNKMSLRCVKTMQCVEKKYTFGFNRWAYRQGAEWISQERLLSGFVDLLNANNKEVILTIFPEPNPRYIETIEKLITFIVGKKPRTPGHRIYGIELEDEENWDSKYTEIQGGSDPGNSGSQAALSEAAKALIDKLKRELPPETKIGVALAPPKITGSTFEFDALVNDERVNFISLQAYQDTHVRNQEGHLECEPTKIDSPNVRPLTLLQNALAVIDKTPDIQKKKIILGLSAYQLDCPPVESAEGQRGTYHMYTVARRAVCEAKGREDYIEGNDYFSVFWVHSQKNTNNYADTFLSSCTAERLRANCGNEASANMSDQGVDEEFKRVCKSEASPKTR